MNEISITAKYHSTKKICPSKYSDLCNYKHLKQGTETFNLFG